MRAENIAPVTRSYKAASAHACVCSFSHVLPLIGAATTYMLRPGDLPRLHYPMREMEIDHICGGCTGKLELPKTGLKNPACGRALMHPPVGRESPP